MGFEKLTELFLKKIKIKEKFLVFLVRIKIVKKKKFSKKYPFMNKFYKNINKILF